MPHAISHVLLQLLQKKKRFSVCRRVPNRNDHLFTIVKVDRVSGQAHEIKWTREVEKIKTLSGGESVEANQVR